MAESKLRELSTVNGNSLNLVLIDPDVLASEAS